VTARAKMQVTPASKLWCHPATAADDSDDAAAWCNCASSIPCLHCDHCICLTSTGSSSTKPAADAGLTAARKRGLDDDASETGTTKSDTGSDAADGVLSKDYTGKDQGSAGAVKVYTGYYLYGQWIHPNHPSPGENCFLLSDDLVLKYSDILCRIAIDSIGQIIRSPLSSLSVCLCVFLSSHGRNF